MTLERKKREKLNDLFVSIYEVIAKSENESIQNGPFPDLSVAEIHTLAAIGRSGKSSMGDVAERLSVTMGTLSVSVKKLEARGYVERKNDENDRRLVLVSLTEKGRKAERLHRYFHDIMIKRVTADMSEEEIEALEKALLVVKRYFYQYLNKSKGQGGK